MDQEEEDWGGTIHFGFMDKKFPQEVEDFFSPFEDNCTMSRSCAGIVMGVLPMSGTRWPRLLSMTHGTLWSWLRDMAMPTLVIGDRGKLTEKNGTSKIRKFFSYLVLSF